MSNMIWEENEGGTKIDKDLGSALFSFFLEGVCGILSLLGNSSSVSYIALSIRLIRILSSCRLGCSNFLLPVSPEGENIFNLLTPNMSSH